MTTFAMVRPRSDAWPAGPMFDALATALLALAGGVLDVPAARIPPGELEFEGTAEGGWRVRFRAHGARDGGA